MHSSKLVTILKCLDRKTFRRLEKFIQYPYFIEVKQRQKILILFQFLQKYYPDFKSDQLDKKVVFAVLFPDQDFAVEKLDKVITRLLKVVRVFVVDEFADADQEKVRRLLGEARFYREQSMDTYFQQSIQQLQRHQQKEKQKGKDHYYTQYLINREGLELDSLFNKRKGDLNLRNTHQSLDVFYLVAKLEYACLMLAQHRSNVPLEVKESLLMLELVLPVIETNAAKQEPLLILLYQAFILLRNQEDIDALEKLRELLDQHASQIPFDQLVNVQAIYRSFYIQEYNRGRLSDDNLFELYRDHLSQGYLFRQGGMQPGLIKNLVALGLKVKAQDWVWQFLEDYKDNIVGTDSPEEVYLYNLASYHFSLAEYEKVLDTLQWYGEDTYYKIGAKRLELKVFYEQRSPVLEAKMDAFKVYIFRIARKILPPLHQEGNNNFINFLRQICHPATFQNKRKINSVRTKIENTPTIVEREWLIDKLKELY